MCFLPVLIIIKWTLIFRILLLPLHRRWKALDRTWKAQLLFLKYLFLFFFQVIFSFAQPLFLFWFFFILSISWRLQKWPKDLKIEVKITAFVLTHQLISLSIYLFLNWDLISLNFGFSGFVFFEDVARRKAMFVFTCLAIWTIPFPSVLIFFNSLKEELADDFWSGTFHHLLLFLAEDFSKFFLGQVIKFLASNCVHDQLGSLINVKINFFVSVQCQIVRVNAFFSLLTESLLKVRTNSVGWVAFIIWVIAVGATSTSQLFGVCVKSA